MKTRRILLPLITIPLCSAVLAGSPFDGTWTLNIGESHMAGETFSVEEAGNGRLKYTDSAESYTFKPDGTAVTTPQDQVQTYQQIGNGIYRATTRQNGVLLTTETWRLSSDGNTLLIDGKGTQPNGQPFDNHFTYIRTSAGTGLVGSWKTARVQTTVRNTLTIQSTGHNDVTLTVSAVKAAVHGKWNGRDYPFRGPTIPAGTTVAVTQTGPGSFELVEKRNAKLVATLRFRLAPDAKSMADDSTDGTGRPVGTQLWNKQ